MNTILVTTDMSPNSKAGLRFAIQLASQHKYELTFFHSYYILKPLSWSKEIADNYEKKHSGKIARELERFVTSVYKAMGLKPRAINCVIKSSVDTDENIMEYARDNKFSFICISTRGAGKLKKMFGTNTSTLIQKSTVPIIAVPYKHRVSKISNVLYATDLLNLDEELSRVVDFAKPLKAKVELLHFHYPAEMTDNEKVMNEAVKRFSKHSIKLHLKRFNLTESLLTNIEAAVKRSKPGIMVMFTEQNRSFFAKLFNSSLSAEYSFHSKVPLLVYNKV
jgi:nucleotide-binding universal stress UspA family protein